MITKNVETLDEIIQANMTIPFRWNLKKREQLGANIIADAKTIIIPQEFLFELRRVSSRILALSDIANLYFIGRTPENFFDYLSGVFDDTNNLPGINLIQFSCRGVRQKGVSTIAPQKLEALFAYFKSVNLDAASILSASRPVALVDYVSSGGTIENLVNLLHRQAKQDSVDWNAVQRNLIII